MRNESGTLREHPAARAFHSAFRIQSSTFLRRGFSFTEVMFAVVVLGIGFIMVAAIFPVAIQQNQASTQESVGAAVVRGALNYLDQIGQGSDSGTLPLFPATNNLVIAAPWTIAGQDVTGSYQSALQTQWDRIRGNLILPDDKRFAFAVLYRRTGTATGNALPDTTWSPYAQVYLIAAQSRARPIFTTASVASPTKMPTTPVSTTKMSAALTDLQPRSVHVSIESDGGGIGVSLVRFDTSNKPYDTTIGAVAEGCFVIIRNDQLAPPNTGLFNGHIYRVGSRRSDLDGTGFVAYELMPGFDFTKETSAPTVTGIGGVAPTFTNVTGFADAYVLGRGFADPAQTPSSASEFEGPPMDVAVYTTWIRVN